MTPRPTHPRTVTARVAELRLPALLLAPVLLAAVLLVGGLPAGAQQAAEPTPALEEIIAKNLAAKGGEEALRSIGSVRVTGTMVVGQVTAPFVWEWKAPDRVRSEFTLQGQTGIQAFDGETAWMLMPFAGQTEPQVMPADQAARMAEQSDFRGPFIDTAEKGYELAYAGVDVVGGTPVHVVEVTHDTGAVTTLYLDAESGLEIQSRATRQVQGQEVEAVTRIGGYEKVGPLNLAHSFEIEMPGSPMGGQSLTFESIELDAGVPDSRFTMPPGGGDGGAGEPDDEAKEAGPATTGLSREAARFQARSGVSG